MKICSSAFVFGAFPLRMTAFEAETSTRKLKRALPLIFWVHSIVCDWSTPRSTTCPRIWLRTPFQTKNSSNKLPEETQSPWRKPKQFSDSKTKELIKNSALILGSNAFQWKLWKSLVEAVMRSKGKSFKNILSFGLVFSFSSFLKRSLHSLPRLHCRFHALVILL